MNDLTPKGFLPFVAFFAMCLCMSCGSGPMPNANSNTNVATQTAPSMADPAASKPPPDDKDAACDVGTIAQRKIDVEAKLKELVADDKELGTKVDVTVEIAGDAGKEFLEVYISSKNAEPTVIGGEDELEDLSRIVRKFFKSKCVRRVIFVAPGTGTVRTRTRAIEWSACEYPNMLCSDGVCKNQC